MGQAKNGPPFLAAGVGNASRESDLAIPVLPFAAPAAIPRETIAGHFTLVVNRGPRKLGRVEPPIDYPARENSSGDFLPMPA